jgi:hypothetical protein
MSILFDSGMKLKIICVAYERPVQLVNLIGCFIVQTNPNWELYIIYDGEVPESILKAKAVHQDKRVFFTNSPERNGNWGHPNRRDALDSLPGEDVDYVLITNDDNYYVPTFVDQMLRNCNQSIGMVYCDTIHSYAHHNLTQSVPVEGGIDMGAFIVKYNIAKKVKFKHDSFTADGLYCEECRRDCAMGGYNIIQVPRPIFVHN